MKNTLAWTVSETVPTGCPDNSVDPYTGQYPTFSCAVYHCKTVTKEMLKQFDSEQEAIEFAQKAPTSCYDFLLNGKKI